MVTQWKTLPCYGTLPRKWWENLLIRWAPTLILGFSSPKLLLCGISFTSRSSLCGIPAEMEGRLRLKGYFHHEMECGRDTQKLVQNQVMCSVNVAQLRRMQTLVVTFSSGFCAYLVGDTLRVCTLHSFGRCRSVWKSSLLYACIAIVHGFPRYAVYFSLGSVWVFRQCLKIWERRFQHTLFHCLLFGLSCIWGKKKSSCCHLFIFNCFILLIVGNRTKGP